MIDLFSGIGGFHLAAEWTWGKELECVLHCEIDKFCQKVLEKHWPDVPIHEDIKTLKGNEFGAIDILTGGFPCQPYSIAGKRKGSKDDRALWPEMFRIIKESRPRWVIGENVTGIINMELDKVLSDLESEGYETQTFIVPACAVNAPHRRNRAWIMANANSKGLEKRKSITKYVEQKFKTTERNCNGNGTNPNEQYGYDGGLRTSKIFKQKASRLPDDQQWKSEPGICRMVDGIPNRIHRLKSLGNSIVPQVAYQIFMTIYSIEKYFEETAAGDVTF